VVTGSLQRVSCKRMRKWLRVLTRYFITARNKTCHWTRSLVISVSLTTDFTKIHLNSNGFTSVSFQEIPPAPEFHIHFSTLPAHCCLIFITDRTVLGDLYKLPNFSLCSVLNYPLDGLRNKWVQDLKRFEYGTSEIQVRRVTP